MWRVRVRGIYATALTWLLAEEGFLLADVSEAIKNRLSQPFSEGPADVTVKSVDTDPDSLLIIGNPWEAGVKVEESIVGAISYANIRRGRLGLYTVVDAVSLGECRAMLPEGLEGIVQGECPPKGEAFRGYVVKDSLSREDKPVVRPGVALVGVYVTVYTPGKDYSFSEHLKEEHKREELLEAVRGKVNFSRVHARFRSNSKYGSSSEVALEAESLAAKAEALAGEEPSSTPSLVSRGEYVSIIYVPSPAKQILDSYRAQLYPTVKFHHSLKAGGFEGSTLVDYSEESIRLGYSTSDAGIAILSYIASNLKGRKINIDHRLPNGNRLTLGPFTVDSFSLSDSGITLALSRVFKTRGVLDGLDVEKRPGDYSKTIVDTSSWHIIHEYYSQEGKLLGVYANINTPPELGFKGLRYLDLHVDIVKKPGRDPEIIDIGELEKAYREELITRSLYEKAVEEARKTARKLAATYP